MNKVVARFGFREEVQRGSVGIKIGLLVEQQCDVYIHLSPRTKQWDTCAPEVILTEAGGRVSDLFGYPLNYNVPDVQNRNGLVASNGVVSRSDHRNTRSAAEGIWAKTCLKYCQLPIADCQFSLRRTESTKSAIGNWQSEMT